MSCCERQYQMIYTILSSILLTTIYTNPSSFNNLPYASLTSYQGAIACNSAITGTFHADSNYRYHAYKLSEFNGIGCTILANLTSTDSKMTSITRSSVLIYTSSGKLYGTSSVSFINKYKSTYYIVFHNSNPKSHSISYKYTLQCIKKCRKVSEQIRRMLSTGSTDDDYNDIDINGDIIGAESGYDESEDLDGSQPSTVSNEEPNEFISMDSGNTDTSSDALVSQEDSTTIRTTSTTSTMDARNEGEDKSGSDRHSIGDSILNYGGNDNQKEVRKSDVVIDFSNTVIENLWAIFLVIVAFNCSVAHCCYHSKQKKVKYVDELPSTSMK